MKTGSASIPGLHFKDRTASDFLQALVRHARLFRSGLLLLFMLTAGLTAFLPAETGAEDIPSSCAGVAANGWLSLRGTQLINQHGAPVQLRGMSSHGIHWFPQYTDRLALQEIKSRRANLFRVAIYADSADGGYNESKEAAERNFYLMNLAVRNALYEDMYAIVDWHILNDQNPLRHLESARAFFRQVSTLYRDNPGVIYEICNEPNGATTWQDIYSYAEQIIPVIRANSPQAVVIVGTPNFSSRLADVRSAPLPFDNIMYAYHYYTGFHNDNSQYVLEEMLSQGHPVFITEWGVSGNEQDSASELAKGRDFVEFMRRHSLSWANWSLSNKDESFSAIADSATRLHGWKEEELTPSGKLVFEALRCR